MFEPDGQVTLLTEFMPLIYGELRRIAGSSMQRERPDHTLQATALVNEVYMRLAAGAAIPWQSDETLKRLEKIDPRQSRLIELRFFAGLSVEETAEVMELSPAVSPA